MSDSEWIGRTLSKRFIVRRLIGKGGMGAVYEAEHAFTKRVGALKLLQADFAASPDVVARFVKEASAAGHIGNTHIVESIDAGELDTGEPYLFMELLEGSPVSDLIAVRGQLRFDEAVEIVMQAADGLAAAHAAGIVHRDVKPENLFLCRGKSPFVKILDFGISKFATAQPTDHRITREGSTLGTPFYMSPEQAVGERDLDARTDVYSLGVVLYECVTGKTPFDAEALPALVVRIYEGQYTPASELRPDAPPGFDAVLARAMARRVEDRFESMSAFRQALAAFRSAPVSLSSTLSSAALPERGGPSQPPDAQAALFGETFATPPGSERAPEPRPQTSPGVALGQSVRVPETAPARNRAAAMQGLRLTVLAGAAVATGLALWLLSGSRSETPAAEGSAPPATAPAAPPAAPSASAAVLNAPRVVPAPVDHRPVDTRDGATPAASPTPRLIDRARLAAAPERRTGGFFSRAQGRPERDEPVLRAMAFSKTRTGEHTPASRSSVARRRRALLLLLLLPSLANPAVAQADGSAPPPAALPHAKEEARQRFDRGITLYNAGDMPGALAEFQRAYRLTAHPVVLYNLALVHANMGEAALAVDALERLKKAGWAGLGDERRERAESVYQEVVRRVGTIAIQTDVDGALVLIDNVDAARTPAPPQRVTAGKHIVALSAPGYEPKRLAVSVAGQAREDVTVTLVPLEDRLAHLALASDVPDVTVNLDGQPIGKTPFATELAFRPGQHEFEWHRDGYVPVRRTVTLQPGTRGAISVPMVASDGGLASGGTLAFKLSETDAVVTLDGKPTVGHSAGLRLPAGRHSVRVERAGFFDVDREVVVTPGSNSLDVRLLPTPEYLGDYVSQAKGQRTLSYVVMGAGTVVALGSGAFLLWNQGQKNDAEAAFDDFVRSVEDSETGMCASAGCEESLNILVSDLEAKRDRDLYGWIGVGVGAAAIGTGAILFALGNDPNRYAPRPESDVFGSLRFHPSIGSCAVTGAF